MSVRKIDEALLKNIDKLELTERIVQWLDAIRDEPWRISVERQRLVMESWKETEGEDIEIRRAKLFAKVLEEIPIAIHPFDLIVGRETQHLLGTGTSVEVCGDYIPGIWDDDEDDLELNHTVKSTISKEDKMFLRECVRYFAGKTPVENITKAWQSVVGTWSQDYEETKGKDPLLISGFLPGTTGPVNWEKILTKGLRGIIEEAEAKSKQFLEEKSPSIDKYFFWQAAIITCKAMINYAHRYANLARQMAEKEGDPKRRAELIKIAEVCEWVPENPARSFHEAIQTIQFIGIGKRLEHSGATFAPSIARADQYLWPYFEKDLYEGHATIEELAEILACGIVHWGTQIFIASSQFKQTHQSSYGINNIMVGGVDRDGEDASNELSYLILHLVGLIKLPSPTINFRWHPRTPRWLLNKAIETNVKTKGGIPLFQNDAHMAKCFYRDGEPWEKARNYNALGCVTPVAEDKVEHQGSEGIGAINVALILDITLHNGVSAVTGKKVGLETGDPRNFKTFDELYEAFKKQHEFVTSRIMWLAAIAREVNGKFVRLPFISSIGATGCMEKGKDCLIFDDDYHSCAISDRALVDTADSLFAIKKLVYDEKKLTMAELMEALDSNFEGERGEEIRQMCLAVPKFGNDVDEIDFLVSDLGSVSASIIHQCNKYMKKRHVISRGGQSWHYYGGLGVGALPNGRKAKEPLNDGSISPMRGADKSGPTAVFRSALKANFDESYSTVLNMKFSSTVVQSPESREKLAILTDAFLRSGGQHVQYNLVDVEELRDAKVNPEKHRDLIVRVGGFSAYFVQLTPEVQDDIILRTEQGGI